jgi:hypothetical protein
MADVRAGLWLQCNFGCTNMSQGPFSPSDIMLALLAEMARSEVETLRERINSGLDEAP